MTIDEKALGEAYKAHQRCDDGYDQGNPLVVFLKAYLAACPQPRFEVSEEEWEAASLDGLLPSEPELYLLNAVLAKRPAPSCAERSDCAYQQVDIGGVEIGKLASRLQAVGVTLLDGVHIEQKTDGSFALSCPPAPQPVAMSVTDTTSEESFRKAAGSYAASEKELANVLARMEYAEKRADVFESTTLDEAMHCLENLASFVGCNGQNEPHTVEWLDERIREGMRYESQCSLNRENAARARAERAEAALTEARAALEAARQDAADVCGAGIASEADLSDARAKLAEAKDLYDALACDYQGAKADRETAERERDEARAAALEEHELHTATKAQLAVRSVRNAELENELERCRGVGMDGLDREEALVCDLSVAQASLTALQARHAALVTGMNKLFRKWFEGRVVVGRMMAEAIQMLDDDAEPAAEPNANSFGNTGADFFAQQEMLSAKAEEPSREPARPQATAALQADVLDAIKGALQKHGLL